MVKYFIVGMDNIKNIEKAKRWWQKEINPTFSFIFLVMSLLVVFAMGAVFMREYMNVWSEISQREKESFFTQDIQKINREKIEDIRFQDIIQP